MYEVLVGRAAERELKRLQAREFDAMIRALKALSGNPRPVGCRKITGSENDWLVRVRDYRIVYEIDDTARTIKAMRVRHQREVYR